MSLFQLKYWHATTKVLQVLVVLTGACTVLNLTIFALYPSLSTLAFLFVTAFSASICVFNALDHGRDEWDLRQRYPEIDHTKF